MVKINKLNKKILIIKSCNIKLKSINNLDNDYNKKYTITPINIMQYRLDNEIDKLKLFVNERDLFNCNFNYKLPNQKDSVQIGKVTIKKSSLVKLYNTAIINGFNNYFKNCLPNQNFYHGCHVEMVNNKYVLKHTDY